MKPSLFFTDPQESSICPWQLRRLISADTRSVPGVEAYVPPKMLLRVAKPFPIMIIFSVLFVHDCRLPRVRKKRIVFLVFVCSFPIDLRSPTRFSFVLLSGPCALCLSFCHVDFLIVDILTAVKTTYNHTKHTHNIAAPSESGRCEALLLYWCLAWYDVRYEPVPPVVCFQFSIQNKKNLTANGGCCCCCCTINPLSLMKFPVAG